MHKKGKNTQLKTIVISIFSENWVHWQKAREKSGEKWKRTLRTINLWVTSLHAVSGKLMEKLLRFRPWDVFNWQPSVCCVRYSYFVLYSFLFCFMLEYCLVIRKLEVCVCANRIIHFFLSKLSSGDTTLRIFGSYPKTQENLYFLIFTFSYMTHMTAYRKN